MPSNVFEDSTYELWWSRKQISSDFVNFSLGAASMDTESKRYPKPSSYRDENGSNINRYIKIQIR